MASKNKVVLLAKQSRNRKISPQRYEETGTRFKRPIPEPPYCCATYVSISKTCPDTCVFKDNGCYVQAGITGPTNQILDDNSKSLDPYEIMELEAKAIESSFPKGVPQDGANGGRDLRIHIGGDVSCYRGATRLSIAAERWRSNGGGDVWLYTHRWREIHVSCWGDSMHVLASVETPAQADLAYSKGYTPALVVKGFLRNHRYELPGSAMGLKLIPCPNQISGITCVECRLCLRKSKNRVSIGLKTHGAYIQRSLVDRLDHIQTSFNF